MQGAKEAASQESRDRKELVDLRAKYKAQGQLVAELQETIERSRNSKFRIPSQGKTRTSKGAFLRLFLPDTHGCFADTQALSAFLGDLEQLNPREIYFMGDHIDCGGFLAQHHTLGFVAECDYTFEDDVHAGNILLDDVQARCPKAKITYLEGNHEERIAKWIVTEVLRNKQDAQFLLNMMGPQSVLSLDKRKVRWVGKDKRHDGLRVQGTVKAGHCFITHGTRHGQNAAKQMLARFNANVVFGHVHKLMAFSSSNAKDGEISAWSVGHLGRQQPLWRHGDPTDWTQGYGFQIVQPDGQFLHINVPVIEGKSLLSTLGKILS